MEKEPAILTVEMILSYLNSFNLITKELFGEDALSAPITEDNESILLYPLIMCLLDYVKDKPRFFENYEELSPIVAKMLEEED